MMNGTDSFGKNLLHFTFTVQIAVKVKVCCKVLVEIFSHAFLESNLGHITTELYCKLKRISYDTFIERNLRHMTTKLYCKLNCISYTTFLEGHLGHITTELYCKLNWNCTGCKNIISYS